jgi:hypothetical protein
MGCGRLPAALWRCNVKMFMVLPGAALVLLVLWDAFETVVLPRRVTRKFRLTRLFYRYTWMIWSAIIRKVARGARQETYLSYYGPMSLILLLTIWAAGVIFGFALMTWAAGFPLRAPEGVPDFTTYLYLSGTTFFTLGLGDVTPITIVDRALTAVESGLGLGLLALVIGYLPAMNQSFSRREVNISLLDSRAGSPPTAAEMLIRQCRGNETEALLQYLGDWERWAAELLESHLSYPVLAYFRSQHDNQSWLGALTVILDTCALVVTGMEGACVRQAQLTFAIARHTIVDLSLVLNRSPLAVKKDRLGPAELAQLRAIISGSGIQLRRGDETDRQLTDLRSLYEPYIYSLSVYLGLAIPPWFPSSGRVDNWLTTAWESGPEGNRKGKTGGQHF